MDKTIKSSNGYINLIRPLILLVLLIRLYEGLFVNSIALIDFVILSITFYFIFFKRKTTLKIFNQPMDEYLSKGFFRTIVEVFAILGLLIILWYSLLQSQFVSKENTPTFILITTTTLVLWIVYVSTKKLKKEFGYESSEKIEGDVYHPVWVSSLKHLEKLNEIYKNASWLRKILGSYDLPPDFPTINIGFSKAPVTFTSSGTLNIKDNTVSFQAKPSIAENTNNELQFLIKLEDIVSIDRYKFVSPLMKHYSLNWIRIKTKNKILDNDLLLCVGGMGPTTGNIHVKTDNLYKRLSTLK